MLMSMGWQSRRWDPRAEDLVLSPRGHESFNVIALRPRPDDWPYGSDVQIRRSGGGGALDDQTLPKTRNCHAHAQKPLHGRRGGRISR